MTKLEELKAALATAEDAADRADARDAWYVAACANARATAEVARSAAYVAWDAYQAELKKQGEKQND